MEKIKSARTSLQQKGNQSKLDYLTTIVQLLTKEPAKMAAMSGHLGINSPLGLPSTQTLLDQLSTVFRFSQGTFTSLYLFDGLEGILDVDFYDIQALSVKTGKESYEMIALSGMHKMLSQLLGISPRTALTGPKMAQKNSKYNPTLDGNLLYQSRVKILEKLGIQSMMMEMPAAIDEFREQLQNDKHINEILDYQLRSLFSRRFTDKEYSERMNYFIAELVFLAQGGKSGVISFHFGPKTEDHWDAAYSNIINRNRYGYFCSAIGIDPQSPQGLAGLYYPRGPATESYEPHVNGRSHSRKSPPYTPDGNDLTLDMPEEEVQKWIAIHRYNEQRLRKMGVGILYALQSIETLSDALQQVPAYSLFKQNLEEAKMGRGLFPHQRTNCIVADDLEKILKIAKQYLEE